MTEWEDHRRPFEDAVRAFRTFLHGRGWPLEILWLNRDRIHSIRARHWVFRPEELASPVPSRVFYEAVRKTSSSLRIDAFTRIGPRTLAYVQNWGGDRKMLNLGLPHRPADVQSVGSPFYWNLLSLMSGVRGDRRWTDHVRIPDRHGR